MLLKGVEHAADLKLSAPTAAMTEIITVMIVVPTFRKMGLEQRLLMSEPCQPNVCLGGDGLGDGRFENENSGCLGYTGVKD